jgi:hypothetical protein
MRYSILLFFPILVISADISAQDTKVVSDFRFDGSVGIEKEFFNRLEIGFESIIKLEKNASIIDEIDFDLDVKYKLFDFLILGIGYRFAENKRKSGQFEVNQRLSTQAEFKLKVDRFALEYRIRYQNVDDDFILYDEVSPPEQILRNKLEVSYNINNCKLSPFLYSELFGNLKSTDNFAFKIKYALGGKYSLGKYGKVKAFYRIIRELNNRNPYTYYNLSIGYVYDF